MDLSRLENLLKQACENVNEGEQDVKNINHFPAILYWPFSLGTKKASGKSYHYVAAYQISLFTKEPPRRSKALQALDKLLRESEGEDGTACGDWLLEYDPAAKIWHSAISLDVEASQDEFFFQS